MITAKERKANFRADLKALLEKHGAEIELEIKDDPYYSSSPALSISMKTVWNQSNGSLIEKESCFFEIHNYEI